MKEILENLIRNSNILSVNFNISDVSCSMYYHPDLVNLNEFNKYYLDKINIDNMNTLNSQFPGIFSIISESTEENISHIIFTGNIILNIDNKIYYKVLLPLVPERTTSESIIDPINVYTSRDGLIENLGKNIALIQRKLKSTN